MKLGSRIPLTVFLSLAAWAAPAHSQGQPSALPGVFGEVLDVRVVNIEVVVTDKQGTPVRGLASRDFRLLVDGEEVAIEFFNEIRSGIAISPDASGEELVPGVPAVAPGSPVGTSFLVFVDDFFSIANDRNRVLDALAEDLSFMAPEDRMAVVAFDGRELAMLSTWSQSPETLRRVLRDAKLRPAFGLHRISDRRQFELAESPLDFLEFQDTADTPVFRRELNLQERAYIGRLTEQINRSVAATAATLRSFAKPPGRKVMLLLSGGWPFVPTDFLSGDLSRLILDREGPFGANLYRRLTETANLLGYTIYPVDVPGQDREFSSSAAQAAPSATVATETFSRELQVHQTLEFLARETGGRAMLNNNRQAALAEAVTDTRSYYWLGFTPSREWDDRQHDVKVEVDIPGFKVRSRRGFLDISRSREVAMAVESSLLFGNSPDEGTLEAELGEPRADGRRRMRVPLEVRLPLGEVTFVPLGDTWVTQLELRIAVVDDDGQQAEMPLIPLELSSPAQPAAGSLGSYQTELRLRRKPHRVVIAVYDPASGRIFSAGRAVEPAPK